MTNEAERQRRARLSSALRENLKRRKAQARARTEGGEPAVQPDPAGSSSEAPPEAHNPVRDETTTDNEPGA